MPDATEEQEEQARKLFPPAEEGDAEKVLSLERDYLIGKYGHLSTEQLAELLSSGKTMVQGGKSVGDFELEMLEPERPFVRNLFLLRVDPTAEVVKAGEADDMKMTDAELIDSRLDERVTRTLRSTRRRAAATAATARRETTAGAARPAMPAPTRRAATAAGWTRTTPASATRKARSRRASPTRTSSWARRARRPVRTRRSPRARKAVRRATRRRRSSTTST
jgi:hypothetical protein